MVEIPSDTKGLETLVEHRTLIGYFLAAGATLLVYDVIINLDAEIEYIWAALDFRKRRIKKAPLIFHLMYLAQRYLPLLDQVILSPRLLLGTSNLGACATAFRISAWSGITGIALSEFVVSCFNGVVVLGIRVWAVWRRKTSIGLVLVAFMLGSLIATMAFYEKFMKGIDFFEPYMPAPVPLRGCFVLVKNKDVYVGWVLMMIHDSETAQHLTQILLSYVYPNGDPRIHSVTSKLVKVVYRDVVSLMNVILIPVLPADFIITISPFLRVLRSLLASRTILRIREVATRDVFQVRDTTVSLELSTLNSDIAFAFSSVFPSTVESEDHLGPEAGLAD
ncbi:hypothetical protein L218DRAFT_948218 [Marasmius fiardii PR-910]|nr:hypothetical protein L218DRAFT_948218 [Marasmius fiardii PR-910]